MKQFILAMFLILIQLFSAIPSYAATIQFKVDGVTVVSDAMPEMRNNRTMVPLRVVSESLGAEVQWNNSEIILSKDNMQVKLQPNSSTVSKNGETVQIDVKPYINKGRTFVPIRFIAETFDCQVSFIDSTVVVKTKKLMVNNQQVSAIQNELQMTMGGVKQQVYGNAFIHQIYDVFTKEKGDVVDAPAHYSWQYDIENPGAYYKEGQYDFLDLDGNSIQRYDVYLLVEAFPVDILLGYPKVLIHDVTQGQWNVYNNALIQNIDQLFDNAERNGFLKNNSNFVV